MTLDATQAYRMLGLTPGATLDEIKTAYRDLTQVWHPDRFTENDRLREKAEHNQRLINEAFAVLRDYRPPPPPVPVPAASPSAATHNHRHQHRARNLKYSLFTGVAAMRHSLEVVWPSATYARKRRRRLPPRAWVVMGLMVFVFLGVVFAALWKLKLVKF